METQIFTGCLRSCGDSFKIVSLSGKPSPIEGTLSRQTVMDLQIANNRNPLHDGQPVAVHQNGGTLRVGLH